MCGDLFPDLGWYYKESYGLSWKARGLCNDLSNLEIFDTVAVWGDILDSHIHHNVRANTSTEPQADPSEDLSITAALRL